MRRASDNALPWWSKRRGAGARIAGVWLWCLVLSVVWRMSGVGSLEDRRGEEETKQRKKGSILRGPVALGDGRLRMMMRWYGFQHCRWWCRQKGKARRRLRRKKIVREEHRATRRKRKRIRRRADRRKSRSTRDTEAMMEEEIEHSWWKRWFSCSTRGTRIVGLLFRYGNKDGRLQQRDGGGFDKVKERGRRRTYSKSHGLLANIP